MRCMGTQNCFIVPVIHIKWIFNNKKVTINLWYYWCSLIMHNWKDLAFELNAQNKCSDNQMQPSGGHALPQGLSSMSIGSSHHSSLLDSSLYLDMLQFPGDAIDGFVCKRPCYNAKIEHVVESHLALHNDRLECDTCLPLGEVAMHQHNQRMPWHATAPETWAQDFGESAKEMLVHRRRC